MFIFGLQLLLDLGGNDSVAAVNWHESGNLLAVGTNLGMTELWMQINPKVEYLGVFGIGKSAGKNI